MPHSEIPGSTPACGSPRLIAAFHVLHRHLAPRHPPCALPSLISLRCTLPALPLRVFTVQFSRYDAAAGNPRFPKQHTALQSSPWSRAGAKLPQALTEGLEDPESASVRAGTALTAHSPLLTAHLEPSKLNSADSVRPAAVSFPQPVLMGRGSTSESPLLRGGAP